MESRLSSIIVLADRTNHTHHLGSHREQIRRQYKWRPMTCMLREMRNHKELWVKSPAMGGLVTIKMAPPHNVAAYTSRQTKRHSTRSIPAAQSNRAQLSGDSRHAKWASGNRRLVIMKSSQASLSVCAHLGSALAVSEIGEDSKAQYVKNRDGLIYDAGVAKRCVPRHRLAHHC